MSASESHDVNPHSIGGIILCGGKSERMGQDKASLPFGPDETMLSQTIKQLRKCIGNGPILSVGSFSSGGHDESPSSTANVLSAIRTVHDREPNRGPLEALATGLHTLASECEIAIVVGCDTPLLVPEFVEQLIESLENHQAAVAIDADQLHPLPGVYRTSVAKAADELLSENRRSLHALLDAVDAVRVSVETLREVDPQLLSLVNCNDDAAYRLALSMREGGPT